MAKNNITSFKIDTDTYRFLGANEKANKKYVWENGKRSEDQATDDKGNLLWDVVVSIVDDASKLSDTAMVTVGSANEPKVSFMNEIGFTNLRLLATSRKEEYGVNFLFSADSITPPTKTGGKTAA